MTARIRNRQRDWEHNKRWPVICFRMYSAESHEALKQRAEEAGVTISELVRSWVAQGLEPEVYE